MRTHRPRLAHGLLLSSLLLALASGSPASAQEGSAAGGTPSPEAPAPEGTELSFVDSIDQRFGQMNKAMAGVIFFDISLGLLQEEKLVDGQVVRGADGEPVMGGPTLPIAVVILVLGAIFFTIRMGLPQLRSFRHAIAIVRGRYDDPDAKGEVTSFQALTAALSATVGLGNIAGVAIAVGTGGPGATFWMILAGFLGMASKFTECTLGQMYREVRPDGRIMGGAMHYLSKGLGEMGLGGLGKVLAVIFAIICIGASLGGGNTFQANQSQLAVAAAFGLEDAMSFKLAYGLVLSVLVGVVIIGGIRRIATTAEKIVPAMCGIYLLACSAILVMNADKVPSALGSIITGAFNPDAMFGGFLGVLIVGFKRAAFSNEAGIGSAAIAHTAAKVPHPSREGIVALLEPFIDTIVVCTMTALVIVITGAYNNPEYAHLVAGDKGAALTSSAMGEQLSFMPYVLAVAVMLFAYSTMISWSYYGERCWAYLFGDGSSMVYRIIFVIFVFLGSVASATNILNFGDLLIFGMVLPNIVGVVLLSGKVRERYDDYMARLAAGEYRTFDARLAAGEDRTFD